MNTEERKSRIIARGEHSNHSHVVVGDAIVSEEKGTTYITVGNEGAVLKHILESNWLQGEEVWTGEHQEIKLEPGGKYKYVQQVEYDPFEKRIQAVID